MAGSDSTGSAYGAAPAAGGPNGPVPAGGPWEAFLFRSCAAFIALALTLGSASSAWAADAVAASRVLASINGVEITQAEVDIVYERAGVVETTPQAIDARKRMILADLVRAEAMAQWAVETGIDSSNESALEAKLIRRQLLSARAERAAQATAATVPQQVLQDVIAKNPLIFAGRRLYTIEEVQVRKAQPTLFTRLDQLIRRDSADLDRAQGFAVESGATVERRVVSVGPESLPQAVIDALATASVGQLFVVQNGPDNGAILAVRAAVGAPMVGDQALQVAKGLASEQMRRAAIVTRQQEVLGRARITYSPAVVAMSEADSKAAAAAAAEVSKAAKAASAAGEGPLIVPADLQAGQLPQGRSGYGKRAIARMLLVGAGALLAGILATFSVFTVVRFTYERFWLPRLWRVRQPEPTPRLAEIVLDAMLHPPRLTLLERASRWFVNATFVGAVIAIGLAFTAIQRQFPLWWALLIFAGAGWVLGVLALYRFARSTARDATRAWRGLVALANQAVVILLAVSVRWL